MATVVSKKKDCIEGFLALSSSGAKRRYIANLSDRLEKAIVIHHLLTNGMSRKDAAVEVGLSTERIRQILTAEDLKVPLSRGRKPITVHGVQKLYSVSDRLNDALNSFGDVAIKTQQFRLALHSLQQNPDQMVRENIGVDEKPTSCAISGLTDEDLAVIESLNKQLGLHSKAAVVRNAIEWLIDHRNLDAYRKPSEWKSRPFQIRQVGKGKRPMPSIGGEAINLFLSSLPESLTARLEALKASDRRQRASGKTRSAFIRRAIDEADWKTLKPLTPEELAEPKVPISVKITELQFEALNRFLEKKGARFRTVQKLMPAVIKQACDRSTLKP